MRFVLLTLAALFVLTLSVFGAECPVFPQPKEYVSTGEQWTIPPDATIVLDGSTPQERYACERLRDKIQLRFGVAIPIAASDQTVDSSFQIVLGLPGGIKLAELLKTAGQTVDAKTPGFNGYAIAFLQKGKTRYILLAGSDVNGVIYGQETLFDMMKKTGSGKVVEVATVRDWPSIPWRGRPHSVLKHHLVRGELDGYVRARLNYTDVRDDPKVPETFLFDARKASMGIPPEQPMDTGLLSRMIAESHRRGFFVYGTVSCSVTLDRFDVLQKRYEDLLKLGVDGLWISMDDTGGGDNPVELVARIVAFCKSRGITGRKIAFTPPPAEYQNIDKPLNRAMAKVPGFDDALWFFTRVPCKEDLAMAREIGLKMKPAWWYNYVETGEYDGKCGFLHVDYLMSSLRRDGRPGYMDLQPLRWGWGFPEYDKLRDAADNTDQVHMWGLCGGWPTEYALVNIGQWAWDPTTFDWNRFRRSVYRYIYGDALVETMFQFDDGLNELKRYFRLAHSWRYDPAGQWPRLKKTDDRSEVLDRIAKLESLAKKVTAEAGADSALDRTRLERLYLEPMRTSLVYAKKYATFDFPEYRYDGLSQRLDTLFFEGRDDEAVKMFNDAVPNIRASLVLFEKTFGDLKGSEQYVAKWNRIVSLPPRRWTDAQHETLAGKWKKFAAQPADRLLPYLKENQQATLASLFKNHGGEPTGNVVARIDPEDWLKGPVLVRGNSVAGLYRNGNAAFFAVGLPQHTATVAGDTITVRKELPVPKFDKRLVLRFYAADTRIDDSARNVRRVGIRVNDREVWSEDVARDQRGKEWRTVDITPIARNARTLQIRFTVDELRAVQHHSSMELLGTVYLIAD